MHLNLLGDFTALDSQILFASNLIKAKKKWDLNAASLYKIFHIYRTLIFNSGIKFIDLWYCSFLHTVIGYLLNCFFVIKDKN